MGIMIIDGKQIAQHLKEEMREQVAALPAQYGRKPCLDVIIVGDTYTPDAVNAVLAISGWQNIKAIKNKAVYAIDGDAFNQPNQYVMNSAYEIGAAVYPNEFAGIQKPFDNSLSLESDEVIR